MSEKRFGDTQDVCFSEEQIETIEEISRRESEKILEKYFNSTAKQIKDLRGDLIEDIVEVLSPINTKFFEVKEAVQRLETWMWILGATTMLIIAAIIFLHT